jgi:integrase
VLQNWLPYHMLEPEVRAEYARQIRKHLLPFFGPMKMRDIMPEHVRQWVTWMQTRKAGARTIQYCKTSILNAIFTTAMDDEVVSIHPSRGVKTPVVPSKPLQIITAEEFGVLYDALPTGDFRLLVETGIESGLRWGELTELRVRDLDPVTRILTVTRAVVELRSGEHQSGERFRVKDYPKDKEYRRFKLSAQITAKLTAHITHRQLGRDDLLFSYQPQRTSVNEPSGKADDLPGLTEPDDRGRRYRHGTLTAYNAARCRCEHCRGAYARYRAARRATGLDSPRGKRTRDTDGHIPADWFRRQIWYPARKKAGLDGVRVHDLRHAHASWLLAGGADLQVVKERLGHASIVTTERYLHTLPTADETALDALSRIRDPQLRRPA